MQYPHEASTGTSGPVFGRREKDLENEDETEFRPFRFMKQQTKGQNTTSLWPSGKAGKWGSVKKVTGVHCAAPNSYLQTHVA